MRIDITRYYNKITSGRYDLYNTRFIEVLFLGDFYHGYSVKYQT